ncbi:MAG: S8 family serine peptidase [Verrucomicrobia bacterium]|nr:S8 family serine peptidase [Verrucomicrobiota bacterium]
MSLKIIFLFALLSFGGIAFLSYLRSQSSNQPAARPPETPADLSKISPEDMDRLVSVNIPVNVTSRELLATVTDKLRQRIVRPNARPNESVLTFKTPEAYQSFLARAAQAGLRITARIDASNTLRVGYDSLNSIARDLIENSADYSQIAANYFITPPVTPPQALSRANRTQLPVGNQLLSTLGVTGNTQSWGNGVTIAVLDSGVAADPTFGISRLKTVDIGLGTAPATGTEGGHGTAVAALAAGQSADAQGIAPAASVLSIRVTSDDGKSDAFTVAKGIFAAVDAGAKIVNISLGGYGTNAALDSAINYATTNGVVLVAAAGNDQTNQLTWPAADPRVVSVGAVDASGQQVVFSNSSRQLQITAPGLALQTAWSDGSRMIFSGTSGSAPIVAGAIAAVMSQDPSLTPAQAWQVLQTHASDAGAPGADPDYGNGVLNLGWAMARNNPTRYDTAVASHYYDSSSEKLQIVVQNRSAQAVAGLDLNIDVNGALQHQPIPWLAAGATTVVNLSISTKQLVAVGQIEFRSELLNPVGTTDQVPTNNRRASTLNAPTHSLVR